jgi:hypothetical protein
MKTIAFISGILSANLMMFGSLFKVSNWPYADFLLILAVIVFCLIFLPFALISWYRASEKKSMLLMVTTFVVYFTGVIAMLFKIEHWDYNMQLMMFAIPLPFILFLPVYILHIRKDKHDKTFIPVMMGLTFLAVFSVLLAAH